MLDRETRSDKLLFVCVSLRNKWRSARECTHKVGVCSSQRFLFVCFCHVWAWCAPCNYVSNATCVSYRENKIWLFVQKLLRILIIKVHLLKLTNSWNCKPCYKLKTEKRCFCTHKVSVSRVSDDRAGTSDCDNVLNHVSNCTKLKFNNLKKKNHIS